MRNFLVRHWFLLILLTSVTAVLTSPHAFHRATEDLPPRAVIAVALFLMAWTIPCRSLANELRHPWAALWALVISYGLVPIAAWALSFIAPTPDVRIGLLLIASVPCTLASCVLWTRFAGGNEATALLVVLASTSSGFLVTTFWLALTTGAEVDIPLGAMMVDLLVTLVVPVGLGQVLRAWSVLAQFADDRRQPLGILAQFCVLSIIFKATATLGVKMNDGVAMSLGQFLGSALLALGMHLFAFFAGLRSSYRWKFDRARSIAVAFAGSQKTLPVALVVFDRYFIDLFPLAIVPLIVYHVGQLVIDSMIAEFWVRYGSLEVDWD